MGGDGEPVAVAAGPDVGVAARAGVAVGQGVHGSSVDDGDVAKDTDFDIMGFEIGDLHGDGGVVQEGLAVEEGAVREGAEEVFSENCWKRETSEIWTEWM